MTKIFSWLTARKAMKLAIKEWRKDLKCNHSLNGNSRIQILREIQDLEMQIEELEEKIKEVIING